MSESLDGLLLLDKPAGMTSSDCVLAAKRKLSAQRVGHTGTLDPSARGLLILLFGKATRTQDAFHTYDKEYTFRAQLGVKTETGDGDGVDIEMTPWDHITRNALREAIIRFTGHIQQIPPRYSALKFKGKPYYHYARRGIEIPRAPRPVQIHSFELTRFDPPFWEGKVVCSRGTYIRTLIEDVAQSLGSAAVLRELFRDRIGPFSRKAAVSWQDLLGDDVTALRSSLQSIPKELLALHG